MHVIAGKAVCFGEAMRPEFKDYSKRIIENAKTLAESLLTGGLLLVSGGTDNHLLLADVTPLGISGKQAETALDACGITVNKNMIPFDERKPMDPSGIRIGTPALTTRGMGPAEMQTIGQWILDALRSPDDPATHERIRAGAVREQIAELDEGPWRDGLRDWWEPFADRSLTRSQWHYELVVWAQLERRARILGRGVHLGTMHSAKGLEFDHVMLLDDGTLADTPEERRLLYVALTRARRSLQIFSPREPSPVFAALRHPALEIREEPLMVADAGPPADHEYGYVGLDAIWLDWLGRQPETGGR